MLKNIMNLKGAQELNSKEQKSIIGGNAPVCEEGYTARRCPKSGNTPAYWNCVPNYYNDACY